MMRSMAVAPGRKDTGATRRTAPRIHLHVGSGSSMCEKDCRLAVTNVSTAAPACHKISRSDRVTNDLNERNAPKYPAGMYRAGPVSPNKYLSKTADCKVGRDPV